MTNKQETAKYIRATQNTFIEHIMELEKTNPEVMDQFSVPELTFIVNGGPSISFQSSFLMNETNYFVQTEGKKGKLDGNPFAFYYAYGFDYDDVGTIWGKKYGIEFTDVKDDKKVTIRPFRNVFGKKIFAFADKAYEEILPLLKQYAERIKNLTPDEKTQGLLKLSKPTNDDNGNQEIPIETDISVGQTTKEDLERLKTELQENAHVLEDQASDELSSGRKM